MIRAAQDSDIRISPDSLTRISGRSARAVSERNYGGLGLGPYIGRTNVEATGGTIAVESEPDRGATITIELPLAGPPLRDVPLAAE